MSAPRRDRGRAWSLALAAATAGALVGGGAWWWAAPPAKEVSAEAVREQTAGPPHVAALQADGHSDEPITWEPEGTIAARSSSELAVFRFTPNPRVLVIDFPDLASQGRTLNRIATWAEKAGMPHDRLLRDADLATMIRASGATPDTYYYGHDYSASQLAAFFALAERDHVKLGPEEIWLRGLIAQASAEPMGLGALISITRAGPSMGVDPAARTVILHHELSHGEYFTDAAYASFVGTIWRDVLSMAERAAFREFLRNDGYDPGIESLMMNEMQAYLMHTPDRRFFDERLLGIPPVRLAAIRAAFTKGMPACWLRDAMPNPTAAAPRRYDQGRSSTVTVSKTRLPPRRRKSSIAT